MIVNKEPFSKPPKRVEDRTCWMEKKEELCQQPEKKKKQEKCEPAVVPAQPALSHRRPCCPKGREASEQEGGFFTGLERPGPRALAPHPDSDVRATRV